VQNATYLEGESAVLYGLFDEGPHHTVVSFHVFGVPKGILFASAADVLEYGLPFVFVRHLTESDAWQERGVVLSLFEDFRVRVTIEFARTDCTANAFMSGPDVAVEFDAPVCRGEDGDDEIRVGVRLLKAVAMLPRDLDYSFSHLKACSPLTLIASSLSWMMDCTSTRGSSKSSFRRLGFQTISVLLRSDLIAKRPQRLKAIRQRKCVRKQIAYLLRHCLAT
jgi:hypothetical protein